MHALWTVAGAAATCERIQVLALQSDLDAQIGVFACLVLHNGLSSCGRKFPKMKRQAEPSVGTNSWSLMRLRKASFWARSAQTAPLRHLFFGAAGYTGQARHTCCNSCVLSCWAWVSMSVDQDAGLISAQAIRLQLGPMAARWKHQWLF